MDSSFSYFRKHTAWFMVVLTVILMLSFVVMEPLMQVLGASGPSGGGSGGSGEVVVSWDGGKLTDAELKELVGRRQLLVTFLEQVYALGAQAAREDGSIDAAPSVAPLRLAFNQQQGVEQDVVNSHILQQAARDSGMTVSDQTVLDYVRALGRNKVDNEQLRQVLRMMEQGNRRLTFEFLFGLVRDELIARNFQMSYNYAFRTVLPRDRYRDWLAVNDRVTVETAAFPASDYLDQVGEPTEVEIEDFYNQHRDREPAPEIVFGVELPSSTPGFALPRRVSLQYLRADYQAALDAERDNVTGAEIAEYYEKNKSQFVKADDLLSSDSLGDDFFGESNDEPTGKSEPANSEADEDKEAAPESSEAEDAAPADEPSSETEASEPETTEPESSKGEAEEAAEKADTAEPTEPTEPTAGEEQSAARPRSPFRFVAMQSDESTPANEAEADETAAAQPASSDPAESETTGGDATEKPAEPAVEYQPLEEVSDTIRRQIAERRAAESIRDLMDQIETDLRKQYNEYFTSVVVNTPAGEAPAVPPASLSDLKPLAEKHGLELSVIEEGTFLSMRDTELGKSIVTRGAGANRPLFGLCFGDWDGGVSNYEPVATLSRDSFDRYLVQRTADLPPATPELSEVRDQVVAAWKQDKAAQLALEAAQAKAAEAAESGQPLVDFFGDDSGVSVIETEPFSRMFQGLPDPRTGLPTMQLGQPAAVTAAGPDFMEAVFDNEKAAAALNHDHTIAYVVRVKSHSETAEELQKGYLESGGRWLGQPVMDAERGKALGAAFASQLVGEEGLDWRRTPDAG